MNLTKIKTFLLVVEHQSFSTVANLLSISQPAVSKQLKTLEEELGVILVDRETSLPTRAGLFVYKRGVKLLADWEELSDSCKMFQNELSGVLRFGASTIPSTYLIPSLVKEYNHQHPKMDVHIYVHESDEILQMLRNSKLDVGMVGTYPDPKIYTSHLFASDHLVFIGPVSTSPAIDIEKSTLSNLKELPIIIRRGHSGTWRAALEGLKMINLSLDELNYVAQADSTDTVISLVEAGLGYSIVSHLAAETAKKHGRIQILDELPIQRNFYLAYLASKSQTPATQALVNLLHTQCPSGSQQP